MYSSNLSCDGIAILARGALSDSGLQSCEQIESTLQNETLSSQQWAVDQSRILESLTMPKASQDSLQFASVEAYLGDQASLQWNHQHQQMVNMIHRQEWRFQADIQNLEHGAMIEMLVTRGCQGLCSMKVSETHGSHHWWIPLSWSLIMMQWECLLQDKPNKLVLCANMCLVWYQCYRVQLHDVFDTSRYVGKMMHWRGPTHHAEWKTTIVYSMFTWCHIRRQIGL